MDDNRQFHNIQEWLKMSDSERIQTINTLWNPYEPHIAFQTKKELVEHFISTTKIEGQQFGIKSFGWTVYMIYVVVENSKQRVPRKFLGMSVNKGIILNYTYDKNAVVKFGYGGKFEMDLSEFVRIS